VALNELTNVIALPYAVGDHEGSLTLFSPAFGLSTFDASAIIDGGGPKTDVPLRTIDQLCEELELTNVCLVKIDVEFYEPNVLRGMKRIVERDRPTILFEALTTQAFDACRAELPHYYEIRHLFQADYVARPGPSIEAKVAETP
jgi:FkbM family methyltransferase